MKILNQKLIELLKNIKVLKNQGITEYNKDSFLQVRLLGKGGFGECYHIINKETKQDFAVKKIKYEESSYDLAGLIA